MKKISIVGFGRFGKTLYRLLEDDFEIIVGKRGNLTEIYSADIVFYAVPIEVFETVIKTHKKHFKDSHLLIDVLSVKKHPKKIFEKYLKGTDTQVLLTHPMFGPDSSKNGFNNLPIVMDKFKMNDENYSFWKNYFVKKGLRVVEMSAENHDLLAAKSQCLTHFVGRLLNQINFSPTEIDTLGAKKLHEVEGQTCNDTWQLFMNLQNFNPYTKRMRIKLGKAYDKLYDKLLPVRDARHKLVMGIQGGKGSFNEEAALDYLQRHQIKQYKIRYLYTSEKVLKNLHEGNVDFGLFAIQNAVGGVVQESTYAMARYKFKIVDEFTILVRHFLMKRKNVNVDKIDTIMAHPQVFKQCRETLKEKYPAIKQVSGQGDLVDTAKAAWALSGGKIKKETFILGPKNLAVLYDLEIVDSDLQDNKENLTTFFLASR